MFETIFSVLGIIGMVVVILLFGSMFIVTVQDIRRGYL